QMRWPRVTFCFGEFIQRCEWDPANAAGVECFDIFTVQAVLDAVHTKNLSGQVKTSYLHGAIIVDGIGFEGTRPDDVDTVELVSRFKNRFAAAYHALGVLVAVFGTGGAACNRAERFSGTGVAAQR